MKEAEKIINCSKYWLNEDKKNRTAVVILANNKEDVGSCCGDTTRNRASHSFSNDRK